jgi:hypothetical protein
MGAGIALRAVMHAHQSHWTPRDGWQALPNEPVPPDVVLLFGGRAVLEGGQAVASFLPGVPRERLFGCSTAGEIEGAHVHDDTLVATSLWFTKASVVSAQCRVSEDADHEALGRRLAQRLDHTDLVHALVLSDGTQVNGSQLVRGLRMGLPSSVTLSGGLSGDGTAMKTTVVCHAGVVEAGTVTVLGFRGPIRVGIGSLGGWDEFGPARAITKAKGNVLYELDHEPALALYKRYLGPHAAGLPSSALLFPLLVKTGNAAPVVRTVLNINESQGSMIFAGDLPTGSSAQLMRANFERLIHAGQLAAESSLAAGSPEVALLISCVGRKLILKQRIEEEIEAVRGVLGEGVTTAGFYSYGELAPSIEGAPCQLHNQTMTITTFTER